MGYYRLDYGHFMSFHPAQGHPDDSLRLPYAALALAQGFLQTPKGRRNYGGPVFLNRFMNNGMLTAAARLVAEDAVGSFEKGFLGFLAKRANGDQRARPPGLQTMEENRGFTISADAAKILPLIEFLQLPQRVRARRPDKHDQGEVWIDLASKEAAGIVTVMYENTRQKRLRFEVQSW